MIFLQKVLLPIVSLSETSWITLALLFATYVAIRSLVIQGGFYAWMKIKGESIRNRVYRVPFSVGQIQKEMWATFPVIIFDALFIATLAKFGPPPNANGNLWITALIAFIWFEIWFYASHRMLHHKRLYFIHAQHHTAKVTSPFTAMSFSLLERFIILAGGIGGIALLGILYPISNLGLALYLFINYILNIFGHSNLEVVPPQTLKFRTLTLLNAPTYHALHHSRYRGHYGLFTPFLDQFFKTRFADYELVQERAYRGQGLSSLSQRLTR